MRAGDLDQRVTIQQPSEAQNSTGEPIQTWVTLATVFAQVIPLRGNELIQAEKISTAIRFTVRIRWRSDVTEKMQVLWGTRILNIEANLPSVERKEYLDLLCAERL